MTASGASFGRQSSYDAASRLIGFRQSAPAGTQEYTLGFNPSNGLVSVLASVDTGISAAYAYDIMDRRTGIQWTNSAGTLRGFTMEYDAASMITNVTRETGERRVYAYDSIDRLVSEAHYDATNGLTHSATFEYDLAGNRTRTVINGVTNTYTLGTGDRLASWGTNSENTVSYDNAGNVTQLARAGRPALDLAWDLQYRLKAVSTNGVAVERYEYDVTGRRIATIRGTNTVRHLYEGLHVVADTDAAGNLLRSYTWGPGIDKLLAMTVYGATATNTYQALTDLQGTVHALVTSGGTVVERYEYDAWGNVLGVFDGNGGSLPSSVLGLRYLFQGREYSWATHAAWDGAGLYYFRARWYDPLTGRWLSNDPIGIGGGLNQYAFCANNPVMYGDALGLLAIIKMGSGGEASVSTAKQFMQVMSLVPDKSVTEIKFVGHGNSGYQGIDEFKNSKEGLIVREGGVYVYGESTDYHGTELESVVVDKLAFGAVIILDGCQTAKGADNIVKAVSESVSGVITEGSSVKTFSDAECGHRNNIAVPFTTKKYRNGKRL